MAISKIICFMEMEFILGKMGQNMLDNSIIIENMERENTHGQMENNLKGIGTKDLEKDKVNLYYLKVYRKKESGIRINV